MRDVEIPRFHKPVLLNEVLTFLRVYTGAWYVDATLGGGGHARGILERGGNVLGIDQDKDALAFVEKRFADFLTSGQLKLIEGNFADLEKLVEGAEIGKAVGVLFDLGTSLFQIQHSGRGFTVRGDEPLDMRMSPKTKIRAADIINTAPEETLYEIFRKFGEERLARPIADAIVRTRSLAPITSTGQLRILVQNVYQKRGVKRHKIDPATRVFQAVRIAVNNELVNLRQALPQTWNVLNDRGRLLVMSFHSLEDRIVKQFFLDKVRVSEGKFITKKPVRPTESEMRINPHARSAKLRVLEKI